MGKVIIKFHQIKDFTILGCTIILQITKKEKHCPLFCMVPSTVRYSLLSDIKMYLTLVITTYDIGGVVDLEGLSLREGCKCLIIVLFCIPETNIKKKYLRILIQKYLRIDEICSYNYCYY